MYTVLNLYLVANLGDIYYIMTQRYHAIMMLHVLHVIQIIEVLPLYIEALHVKALHFKANCMDFF